MHQSKGLVDCKTRNIERTNKIGVSLDLQYINQMEEKRITIDPNICHGKPCIRGLRYPVELILDLMASGMSNSEILSDYPDLEKDDLFAVIKFAADLVKVKNISKLVA